MKAGKLKKVIQELKLDEPADSFEARVMSRIEASEDLSLKPALARMVKRNISAEPADFFTAQVMSRVKPKKQSAALPVISARAWYWVAGILAVIIAIAVFSSSKSAAELGDPGFRSVSAVQVFSLLSQQMIPYLVALSSLLLIDYFWGRRRVFSS